MSLLQKYIDDVKVKTKNYSEIEKMRYVYIDLGKRINFDLDYSFGNSEKKRKLYNKMTTDSEMDKMLENNIGICKSISYIYAKIMQSLGIDMKVSENEEQYEYNHKNLKHIYDYYIDKNGHRYQFDIQQDMMNIKARMRTTHFGMETPNGECKELKQLVSRHDLETIDKKIGYISEGTNYYTDDYIELIKMGIQNLETINEKMKFILENSDGYLNDPIDYADREWRLEFLLGKSTIYRMKNQEEKAKENIVLLNKKDSDKVEIFNCYKGKKSDNSFKMGVAVYGNNTDIYLFDEKNGGFDSYSLDEFANKTIKEKITMIDKVKGLGAQIKKIKAEDKEK